MSCANPLPLYEFVPRFTNFHNRRLIWSDLPYRQFMSIPCGRCLNCRIDKVNMFSDRCEYELIKRRCGAFVTFTYDDIHIQHLLRKDSSGKLVASLSRDDSRRFLYRLNKNVKKELKKSGYDTLPFMQKDYKYILSGEYGDHGTIFDRPHFHAIFFGLDFAMCKKLFARSWRGQGEIKVLPVTQGAPQYLLDYITTMEFGEMRKIKYEYNNLEAPFQVHSVGLGNGLYTEQLDYIKSHNCCYRWHGRDVPLPTYYRDKYLLPKNTIYQKFNNIKAAAYFDGALPLGSLHDKTYLYDLHNYQVNKNSVKKRKLEKASKRPIVYQEYLDEELHNWRQKHNQFYRELHPMPHDLGISFDDEMNMFYNYDLSTISELASIATQCDIPF